MNKISYTIVGLFMATLMIFSSCKKHEAMITPNTGGTVTNTFTASVGDGSKTFLDGTKVYWSEYDYFWVNGKGDQNNYVFQPEYPEPAGEQPPVYEPATSGTFVNQSATSELVSDHYFAAYQKSNNEYDHTLYPIFSEPVSPSTCPSSVSFIVPQSQYSLNYPPSDGYLHPSKLFEGSIPMAAYSNDKTLEFHNMVNIIKLVLTPKTGVDPQTISKVTISSTGQNLWGVFSVSPTVVNEEVKLVPTAATLPNPSTNTPEIYVDFSATEAGPIQLNEEKTIYFMMPVASSATNTIKIKVSGGQGMAGGTLSKEVTLESNNIPNQMHIINLDVEFEPMPFYYSVAENPRKLVEFSPSNLCYGGYDYLFEENSTYTIDQTYYTTSYNSGKVDHLVWTNKTTTVYGGTGETQVYRAYYGWGYNVLQYPYFASYDPLTYNYAGAPFNPAESLLFTNETATTPNSEFEVLTGTGKEKGIWRSLSVAEMDYLIGTTPGYNPHGTDQERILARNGAWDRCGKVTIKVNGSSVNGFLILADNYDESVYSINSLRLGGPYGNNYEPQPGYVYEYKDLTGTTQVQGQQVNIWDAIKDRGVVFLPSSGRSLCNQDGDYDSPVNQEHYSPICYTFDGCGSYGSVYLSNGISEVESETTNYPYGPNKKQYNASCLYWGATGNVQICTSYETKYGRLIRLVKDFEF